MPFSLTRAATARLLVMMGLGLVLFVAPANSLQLEARVPGKASSFSQAPADWTRYSVKDEEFSVLLPIMPAMATSTVYLSKIKKDRQQRVLGAYADGVVYAIYTFENPKRRQSLDDLVAEFYQNEPGRDVTAGGFPGREFSYRTEDKRGVSQFYMTERHIYLFRAVGSSLGNPEVGIPRFFSSLRFEKRPEGLEVVDGPGEMPNSDPSRTDDGPLTGKNVTLKAAVIAKPEPRYTEDARRNQITGTVVLRVVFSSSGAVTDIKVVSGLPHGLTERAIEAGRQIRFIPAIKDGHFVSMYIQLEYNFNLY